MQASELYSQILGIDIPWFISNIELDERLAQITVVLSHGKESKFPCSCCGELSSLYDHSKARTWRHLDTCQYSTYLRASVPRVRCNNCGVLVASIPWAQPHSRFSEMFECHVIDYLQNCQVIERSAVALKTSPDQVRYLMKKSVERGLSLRQAAELPIKRLAIDEKSQQSGHCYVTILSDADEGSVLAVSEGRTIESVQEAYNALTDRQLGHVQSVTMDMWSAFETVTQQVIPHADVVYDRFHLSVYLNNSVDITRRAENKRLAKAGDESLKKTKYLWLKNPHNYTAKDEAQLSQLKQANNTPELIKVFELKEEFRAFFACCTTEMAKLFFYEWQEKVITSQNTHLIKVAKMFEKHLEGMLHYIQHRVSNAIAEGLNSRIQQLKAKARGFRSAAAFRIAILFHFGKLYLYPA